MVITQLEAQVASHQWETLQRAYQVVIDQPLPPYIHHTFLVQDASQPEIWRILTIWKSHQALEDYRASVETPSGGLMFRAAGAEPTLTRLKVVLSTLTSQ